MTTSSNRSSTVGIVTTVWSYEEYLPGWCKSIRALERQPDKVVVAAHNAENVVSIMASELPQAIVVPVEEEFTLAHYLNKAVEVCDTDWVGWIGADDRYRPTAFNGIDECKSDIISFGMKYSDNGREWHYGNDLHNCFFYNPVPCGSPFRRWIWEKIPFQTKLSPFEDWTFWTGAHLLGASIEGTSGRVDFDYAIHPGQIHLSQEQGSMLLRKWAEDLRQQSII